MEKQEDIFNIEKLQKISQYRTLSLNLSNLDGES